MDLLIKPYLSNQIIIIIIIVKTIKSININLLKIIIGNFYRQLPINKINFQYFWNCYPTVWRRKISTFKIIPLSGSSYLSLQIFIHKSLDMILIKISLHIFSIYKFLREETAHLLYQNATYYQ